MLHHSCALLTLVKDGDAHAGVSITIIIIIVDNNLHDKSAHVAMHITLPRCHTINFASYDIKSCCDIQMHVHIVTSKLHTLGHEKST